VAEGFIDLLRSALPIPGPPAALLAQLRSNGTNGSVTGTKQLPGRLALNGGQSMGIASFLGKLATRLSGAAATPTGRALAGGAVGGTAFAGAQQFLQPQQQQAVAPFGGGFSPAGPRAPRGKKMTAEFTVFPDGTRVLNRMVPGGVALFQRDVTAAKRVNRIVRKSAPAVGLKAVAMGRKLRKG